MKRTLISLVLAALAAVLFAQPADAANTSQEDEWQRTFALFPVRTYDNGGRDLGYKMGFLERRLVKGYNYLWRTGTRTWVYRQIPDYRMKR
jgi:hypothetical protein